MDYTVNENIINSVCINTICMHQPLLENIHTHACMHAHTHTYIKRVILLTYNIIGQIQWHNDFLDSNDITYNRINTRLCALNEYGKKRGKRKIIICVQGM